MIWSSDGCSGKPSILNDDVRQPGFPSGLPLDSEIHTVTDADSAQERHVISAQLSDPDGVDDGVQEGVDQEEVVEVLIGLEQEHHQLLCGFQIHMNLDLEIKSMCDLTDFTSKTHQCDFS